MIAFSSTQRSTSKMIIQIYVMVLVVQLLSNVDTLYALLVMLMTMLVRYATMQTVLNVLPLLQLSVQLAIQMSRMPHLLVVSVFVRLGIAD
jgi:hypothetical protein